MSTYRIFINNSRVSTAVALEDGAFLQVYPSKELYQDKISWLYQHVMVRDAVTVVDPAGVSQVFTPELYTLMEDRHFAASAGVRIMKEFYLQWFPCEATFSSRDALVGSNIKDSTAGAELCIHRVKAVHTVLPGITFPEEPKLSRWDKMSNAERTAWKERMRIGRMLAKERVEAMKERRAAEQEVRFLPNPFWGQEREEYWTAETPGLSPALRMVLAALGPVRSSGEGCDCGEC